MRRVASLAPAVCLREKAGRLRVQPGILTDKRFQSKSKKDGCVILPNHLLIFIGSLQVFSAVWLRAPQLRWEVHRHGDDESGPGYAFEEIPCEDIAKTMYWKHAQKKWLVLAPQRGQTPCENNFHSKESRQVHQAVKHCGQCLLWSILCQPPDELVTTWSVLGSQLLWCVSKMATIQRARMQRKWERLKPSLKDRAYKIDVGKDRPSVNPVWSPARVPWLLSPAHLKPLPEVARRARQTRYCE